MRTIGMTNAPAESAPEKTVSVTPETTKQEMISLAQEEGLVLTPAEKRYSKEKLAALIESKIGQNNEDLQ